MKVRAFRAFRVMGLSIVVAFLPVDLVAQSSTAATAAPALSSDAFGASQVISQAEELRQELRKTQQMLLDQAEILRSLQQQVERQGREIESLRGHQPLASEGLPAFTATSSDADAARLRSAVRSLRDSAPTPSSRNPDEPRASSTQTAPSANESSELFFRIGNATFTPSGWVDFTTYFRGTNVGSGLGTSFQSIPFNNTVQGGLSETRITAQSSRFAMRVDEMVGKTNAYGYVEADFNGYLPGNAYVSTNSNTLRMRVFYLNLARTKWEILGGQGWSLLTPTRKGLSPFLADLFTTFHLDTNYQAGLIYARQAQFRLVFHPTNYWAAGLSVENTDQYSGSAVTFPSLFSSSESDTNSSTPGSGTATPSLHPDLIAKTTIDHFVRGLYWHIGVAGLLTSVRIDTPASVSKSVPAIDSHEGGAIAANAFLELFKGFHLLWLGYWSDGGGRYIGGMGPGFIVVQEKSATAPFKAELIHSGSGIGGFEWAIDRRTTLSGYFSSAYFQRRYALDPVAKTATYAGYGFPGSANTNNRTIQEASFASITTLWQRPAYGALQAITQASYVTRAPWYVAAGQPKNAHMFMEFVNLRYVLP
jgi:RecA/RadA recombinase